MSDQFNSREARRKANSKSSPSPKKGKKRKKGGLFKKTLFTLLILFVLGVVGGAVTFAVMVSDAPSLDESKLKTPYSSTIYDKNGKEIAEVGAEKRTYVSIDEIPDVVKEAFIATEDARFYEHHGIDPVRIGGALVANFKDGFGAEGGSTITQQVVKNSLLSHQKTLKRKVQEVWLSIQLERNYSKDEILEMYLNRIYFSPRAYGIGKAAEEFFGVTDLSKLTVEQAATLAGMPQSPTAYNPVKNPDKAEKRRNIVLSLMKKQGFISDSQYNKAKKVAVKDEGVVSQKEYEKASTNKYSAFVEEVMKEIDEKSDVDPSADGLKIYTTLDTKAQDKLDELMDGDTVGFTEGMQGGVTLLDTKTGEVRAIGAGRDSTVGGYNYATQAQRQPGSTIKPILDYGPVIENKKWSTYEQIDDSAYTYSDGTPIRDFDRSYKGVMSMREALAQSRNIPALKAFQAVGKDAAVDFANGLGLGLDKDTVYESYSIGGFGKGNVGVSSLTMAGAYSAFGNNGTYNEPHFVKSIEFNDGTKLDLTPKSKSAMSDYTAFMITDMLKTAVKTGTGQLAQVPGVEVAGKTGTTNFDEADMQKYNIAQGGVPDSWFVGYTPQYTAAVWTGVDSQNKIGKKSLNKTEQQIAKRIFAQLIADVDDGSGSFEKPDSVVEATVEKGSNPAKLAGPNTPSDKKLTEYFVKGTAPSTVSKTYEKEEKEETAKLSGLNVKYDKDNQSLTLSWNYDGDATFAVKQSVDGGSYSEIQNSSAKEAVISGVQPGSVYKFEVTAVSDDGKSTASTSYEVPKAEDDEDKKDQQQTDDEKQDDEKTQDDTQNDDSQKDDGQTDQDQTDDSTNDQDKKQDNTNTNPSDNNNQDQSNDNDNDNSNNQDTSDGDSNSGKNDSTGSDTNKNKTDTSNKTQTNSSSIEKTN
ncbi:MULTISPECIES: transglycosylase domain-containing protein [Bacillus]|uniref:transglycosylase domain-containing protein n=1 Tax=Bacillus TaxID=1386 RepID=UPI0018EA2D51|nr:PBP1A family penicillin-binding protein [Bacillus subtilis]MBJ3803305.1 PBP1A family penicillin-binding protein [Bacillus subtilis]MBR0020801.1 PBP1A family penicillin-binding protein [Bacillus subtilis]MEC2387751.1 PBP1A family penicillin-binding protein [Bacillus subtilis]MEC3692933.1 PBP1A family penicillin-binding protein [Bacillus subtilis]MED4518798.1 PBP1A family penicillin-binding protein [Bacillus subtilis]